MGAYKGKASTIKEADSKVEGFKKGGKADKMMSHAAEKRPMRKSGGSVFSSASSGTPRGKASHY
jgi:hypothetical protein